MDWFEAAELAARVVGVDPDGPDFDERKLERKLVDKWGIGLEEFQSIATALVPFTPPAVTAMTNAAYQGFVYDGAFIYKQPVKPAGK